MDLRIPDAPAMVAFLYDVVSESGSLVLSVDGWRVVDLGGRLFYHGVDRTAVGGPYAALGALLRDAGHRRHAEWSEGEPKELLRDVVEWGGAFFSIRSDQMDAPTRHESLDAAAQPHDGLSPPHPTFPS